MAVSMSSNESTACSAAAYVTAGSGDPSSSCAAAISSLAAAEASLTSSNFPPALPPTRSRPALNALENPTTDAPRAAENAAFVANISTAVSKLISLFGSSVSKSICAAVNGTLTMASDIAETARSLNSALLNNVPWPARNSAVLAPTDSAPPASMPAQLTGLYNRSSASCSPRSLRLSSTSFEVPSLICA